LSFGGLPVVGLCNFLRGWGRRLFARNWVQHECGEEFLRGMWEHCWLWGPEGADAWFEIRQERSVQSDKVFTMSLATLTDTNTRMIWLIRMIIEVWYCMRRT